MNKRIKRILKITGITILSAVLIFAGVFTGMFHREIRTLNSIEKLDEHPLYTMEYKGDYGMDEFLEVGACNDQELVEFVVDRLLKGLPLEINIPSLGCSTFLAKNEESDGYLFGRNFDLNASPGMFVRTQPEDGYASISMVNLGFIGYGEEKLPDSMKDALLTLAAPYAPLDGMNEKGLCVGVLLIDTEPTNQQTEKVDITTTTAIRMLLDQAATVEEAVELLKQYDMHSSANSCYHFQIADASGNSVVVEYIDHEMKVVRPEESYQAATNFLLTPGDYDFGKGQDRYAILMDTLKEQNGIVDSEEAMELLQAASQDPHRTEDGDISATQWSVVYDMETLSATICMGQDYENTYTYSVAEPEK